MLVPFSMLPWTSGCDKNLLFFFFVGNPMRFSEALVCCTALSEELRANMQQEIQAKAYVGLGGFSDLEDKKM